MGKGKLDELKAAYKEAGAEVLLVDDELDPTQLRTLENALDARVIDRTQLILDIFAQHAVTAEGSSRSSSRSSSTTCRGCGACGSTSSAWAAARARWARASACTRGPGESQLESDRRMARRRITVLKRRLETVERQRQTRRKQRTQSQTPVVALAGYTNVGKSTLLNALTGASVSIEDRLFETLDPTTRAFEEDGRRYLVTDTVGFIRRLPTQLVEGFAATLEETLVADVILHVLDGSAPDDRLTEQKQAVEAVLHEIGADEIPVELVLNKIDAVDPLRRRRLENAYPDAVQVSAATGAGLDALKHRIAERFADRFEPVQLLVPYDAGTSSPSCTRSGRRSRSAVTPRRACSSAPA